MSEGAIRVAVVDDQRLFAKGLSGLVQMLEGVEVVGVAFDGEEAVALCRQTEPDVVLMDTLTVTLVPSPAWVSSEQAQAALCQDTN